MDFSSKHLLLHGAVVLIIGLMCGVPYGSAILRKDEEGERAWKLAHGALSLGATSMIAIAAAISFLTTHAILKWGVSVSFIVSGYGFSFALVAEGVVRERGLAWTKSSRNNLVYVGNSVGAWSSLIGAVLLLAAVILSF